MHHHGPYHDYQLQEYMAAAGDRGLETEHVIVEWVNGAACCYLDCRRPSSGCGDANENETGGVVGRPV